jgi:hypothetical protein
MRHNFADPHPLVGNPADDIPNLDQYSKQFPTVVTFEP